MQRRREEVLREMQARKAKVQRDKQLFTQNRMRSVRRHERELQRVVGELKTEAVNRKEQINEMKEREIENNQVQARQIVQNSPFK